MKFLDDPKTIVLKRTQYAIRPKQSRWQRIVSRFTQAVALASITATVAAIVFETLTPALFPLPA